MKLTQKEIDLLPVEAQLRYGVVSEEHIVARVIEIAKQLGFEASKATCKHGVKQGIHFHLLPPDKPEETLPDSEYLKPDWKQRLDEREIEWQRAAYMRLHDALRAAGFHHNAMRAKGCAEGCCYEDHAANIPIFVPEGEAPSEVINTTSPLRSLAHALAKVRVPVRWAGLRDEDGFYVSQNYLSTPLPVTLRVNETPNQGYSAVLLKHAANHADDVEVAADHRRGLDDMMKLCAAVHAATSVKDVAEAFAAFDPRLNADKLVRRIKELSQ